MSAVPEMAQMNMFGVIGCSVLDGIFERGRGGAAESRNPVSRLMTISGADLAQEIERKKQDEKRGQ